MSSEPPKLRGKGTARRGPYPLGEFPDDMAIRLARQFVHRLAVGHANITGDDWGEIFATAISGNHRHSPIGVTDVVWNGCSWSVKTVQAAKPFEQPTVRLISGRNSPAYSYGISDPLDDLAKTGQAVLNIWNERVNQSLNDHDDLRVVVLVRNMDSLEFALFEYEAGRYSPRDYVWKLNPHRNLEGYEISTGEHRFTWQPHGSQFTVIRRVPGSAYKFRIVRHPGLLEAQHVLNLVRFKDNWVERVFE
jgi:hypothetical protein